MDNNLKLLAVASGALVVMACQSPTPRNASLEQARLAYQITLSDPALSDEAAAELKQARRMLRAAERVWADGGDEATTRTLARMASRQVEVARAMTAGLRPVGSADESDGTAALHGAAPQGQGRSATGTPEAPNVRALPVTVSRSIASTLDTAR